MKSSRQGGSSYRTIVKEDLESFPFPDVKVLSASQRDRILTLAKDLQASDEKPWDQIDRLVFEMYGLDEYDATVVRDTVSFCGSYRSVREPAELPATPDDQRVFCEYLEEMLQPLFRLTGDALYVRPMPYKPEFGFAAWQFASVTRSDEAPVIAKPPLSQLTKEANSTGASRVTLRIPSGLLIGILNQRRFWTRSRARLCSLHIEEEHLDAFEG